MSYTRVNLILSTQQTSKSVILVPSPPPRNVRNHILAAAKSKLKCKKPSRIFLPGGHELLDDASVSIYLTSDSKFLISSGEDYVGNVSMVPMVAPGSGATVTVICDPEDVDPLALTQLDACKVLPGMVRIVGLPDLHPGDQFPIGGAFATDGYVHPQLIGGDIGCGMSLYELPFLNASKLDNGNGWKKVAEALTGLEGPWYDAQARRMWVGGFSAGDKWDDSIGTIGKGNHFAEIQVIEEAFHMDESQNPLEKSKVVLLVHSGSRGYGQHILSEQRKLRQIEGPGSSLTFPVDSPEASNYLQLHEKALGWANLNRDLIALRFIQKLEESSEWSNPSTGSDSEEFSNRLSEIKENLSKRRYMSIFHNAVIPTHYPPLGRPVLIHRKGAAPAQPGATFLPIPGSRGTRTLFVQPLFTPDNNNGLDNLYSVAHGAGRRLTRTKALRTLKDKYANNIDSLNSISPAEARSRAKDKGSAGRVGTVLLQWLFARILS